MKKLTQRFQEIHEMLGGICDEVYHYWADARKSNRYIIWQERGESESHWADNHQQEQVISVDIELYVLDPLDNAIDAVQELLNAEALSWSYDGSQYETDTGLIHHSWRCEFG